MPIFAAAVIAGASLYSGYKGSQAAKKGGAAAQAAAYENAADIRGFGEFNASNILGVGAINAQAIIDVGEVNANYIERSTERNIFLYGLQADEDVNRHVRAEKQVAGDIRARASGSGIQVNTGSPLQFLNAQVDEGIRQREFMVTKHTETLFSMAEEGKDRAFVTRFTAEKNAEVTMANAEANAAMAIANAELTASQQETSGDLAYETGQIAGSAAMIQGITGAITNIAGMQMGATAYTPSNSPFQTTYTSSTSWSSSWGSNVALGANIR